MSIIGIENTRNNIGIHLLRPHHVATALFLLVILLWMVVSRTLQDSNLDRLIVASTIITVFLLGFIIISFIDLQLSKKLKGILILWLLLKIVIGLGNYYVLLADAAGYYGITQYGDHHWYNKVAQDLAAFWTWGTVGQIPGFLASQVEQIGYPYFLGFLYFITGPLPETGILFNSLLAFILCILGYKLFLLSGMETKYARTGLLFLFLSPMLWWTSSGLLKDPLVFVVLTSYVVCILSLIRKFKINTVILAGLLLIALVPLRFAYFFIAVFITFIGYLWLSRRGNIVRKFGFLLCLVFLLAILVAILNHLGLYKFDPLDFGSYFFAFYGAEPVGGRFMVEGSSHQIYLHNFWYALPAKALYISTIPYPWFGGDSLVARAEYLISHMDSVYFITVVVACVITYLHRKKILISKERWALLFIGLIIFIIPLFHQEPTRRHIAVSIPFFLAYCAPTLAHKENLITSSYFSIFVIIVIQFFYYSVY